MSATVGQNSIQFSPKVFSDVLGFVQRKGIQGTFTIKLSKEALTMDYIEAHKVEFMNLITSIVISQLATAYNTPAKELPNITNDQLQAVSNRVKLAMVKLRPAMLVGKKMLKDEVEPYADWTKFINSKIQKEYPDLYAVIKDSRIEKCAATKSDHFIFAKLIQYSRPTQAQS